MSRPSSRLPHAARALILLTSAACVHVRASPRATAPVSRFTTEHVREGRAEYRVTAWPVGDTIPRAMGSSSVERHLVQHDGRAAVLSVATFTSPRGTVIDSGLTMLGTLLPVWERSHQPTKTMSLDFAGAHVTGSVTPTGAATATAVDHLAAEVLYNSSDIDLFVTSIPLAAGYATTIPTYVYERGGLEVDSVRVVGPTTLTLPSGGRDVWEVAYADATITMTLWIDRRSREVLQRETVPRKAAVHIRTELLGA